MVITRGESRSYKRASRWLEQAVGLKVSANTIVGTLFEVNDELSQSAEQNWQGALDGEAIVRQVVVGTDGGRINDGLPGVRLAGKG